MVDLKQAKKRWLKWIFITQYGETIYLMLVYHLHIGIHRQVIAEPI